MSSFSCTTYASSGHSGGRDILILTSSCFFLLHLRAFGGDAAPSRIRSQALPGNWRGLDPSSLCSWVRPRECAQNAPCIARCHRRPRLLWGHAKEDRTDLRADRLCGVSGEVSFISFQLEKWQRNRSLWSRYLPTPWSRVRGNEWANSADCRLSFYELFGNDWFGWKLYCFRLCEIFCCYIKPKSQLFELYILIIMLTAIYNYYNCYFWLYTNYLR